MRPPVRAPRRCEPCPPRGRGGHGGPDVRTIQAYRFALDHAPGQERAVNAHVGAARVAHNWALARVKAVLDQRAAERSYGVPDVLLTPSYETGRRTSCDRKLSAVASARSPYRHDWERLYRNACNGQIFTLPEPCPRP
ncbi:helix-turn-helix domain-containing protein [Micromonospora chersina]|uniref:helix-turn-helix domain-containing protein n=1 Tax=Micromonospora chersina TaxID=47854 RepID=UPI00371AA8C1